MLMGCYTFHALYHHIWEVKFIGESAYSRIIMISEIIDILKIQYLRYL